MCVRSVALCTCIGSYLVWHYIVYLKYFPIALNMFSCYASFFLNTVPQFHITSSTSTSITVQFQYTGPPPHGHEVVVENKDLNSVLSYSRYFQISILHAVISGLSPNTEYVLHIRTNGSHHAGNYGRWKSVEVKTHPAGVCMYAHHNMREHICHTCRCMQSCFAVSEVILNE